VKIDS